MSSQTGTTSIATGATGATTTTSSGETSIRVVIFSGKRDDWESWKEKFSVKAAIRGYEDILDGTETVPATHFTDGTKRNLTADEETIINNNKKGFGDLILSIDCTTAAGKVAFAMVKGTKTKENPQGNLRAAFLRLKTKYEPSTTPQLMQLTKDFHSKSLNKNQDPDIFITELEALKVKMHELGHEINDKSLILHVLNNLNENYEMEIKMLEHRMQLLNEANKEMTIEEFLTELNLRYERLKKHNDKPIDHAYYMGNKFKGKCHWCGKIGHKSVECKLRITSKQ